MGFWSGLGKILGPVAGIAAAPFTGGASLIPTILQGAGSVVGAMGGASTANRGEQDRQNLTRDQVRVQEAANADRGLLDRAALEIKQRDAERAAQKEQFAMALRSALAMNTKDASFSRPQGIPMISFAGGARPSALGAQGREAASLANNQALQALMNPQTFAAPAAPERVQMSEPSKASFWEKLAGPVGMGLTIAGQGLDARNKPAAQPQPQQPLPGGGLLDGYY
jgi:hypothetical protein